MKIQLLPAENGDCILVEHAPGHYFVIDGGYVDTANRYLGPMLERIGAEGGVVDVIVVTHIDRDHISGIIELLERELSVPVGEIWYNGYRHIQSTVAVTEEYEPVRHKTISKELNPPMNRPKSARQGCSLSKMIASQGIPWNVPAEGGVMKAPMSFQVGETKVHILSPNQGDIKSLEKYWRNCLVKENLLEKAHSKEFWDDAFEWDIAGEEAGFQEHVAMDKCDDMDIDLKKRSSKDLKMSKSPLEQALEEKYTADGSAANGSSIAFVLESPDGTKVLFLGDAHAETIVESLEALYGDAPKPYRFDAVKLSHHGSFNNSSPALLDLIDSDKWIVSTNGATFHHPEMATLARIITRGKGNKIYFNYDMDICTELRREDYHAKYDFEVVTPGGKEGITVTAGTRPGNTPPVAIGSDVLDALTAEAKALPLLRKNLDLRNSTEDLSQRMLNALEPGTELPIHRHRKSSETVLCIRGHFEEYFYDDDGKLTETFDMAPGGLVLNIPIGQWHSVKSLASGTVTLECKDGPWEPLKEEDILR